MSEHEEITKLRAEHKEISDRAEALAADLAVLRQERASLRAELAATREERDKMRLALLDAELVLSAGGAEAAGFDVTGDQTPERQRLFEAERRAAEMARELDATHRTVSWRVTAPLRAVRKKMDRP
ncbi:hypothetical protein SAMN05421504_1021163 [Amycolatopsis xylanica]|uniref:Uncharacterized protein n=1 Tax=Amycolatopsis xylanica TaxID=589385 RepID=A0A1H3B389_9PSEU|nr:hypothetical protein [Amycolatopsis xylanica]SDX36392.1 hypothetical protein SAMN05421504_1021163 [Amycolatopsis xylanica]